jgi:hypothetical protein
LSDGGTQRVIKYENKKNVGGRQVDFCNCKERNGLLCCNLNCDL